MLSTIKIVNTAVGGELWGLIPPPHRPLDFGTILILSYGSTSQFCTRTAFTILKALHFQNRIYVPVPDQLK